MLRKDKKKYELSKVRTGIIGLLCYKINKINDK